jgi:hypothetical protein
MVIAIFDTVITRMFCSGYAFLPLLFLQCTKTKIVLNISAQSFCEELNKWTPEQTNLVYSNVPQQTELILSSE